MHHKKEHNNNDILKGLAAGLIGGLVGTIVMTQYQNLVTQIGKSANGDDKKEKKKEKEGSENATVKTAKAISETVFDHKLKKSEKETAGNAVHYVFGTTVGALYGAAAEAMPITAMGYGLAVRHGTFYRCGRSSRSRARTFRTADRNSDDNSRLRAFVASGLRLDG